MGAQNIVNGCYLNQVAQLCNLITRSGTNPITRIENSFQNNANFDINGVDIELSYRHPIAGGAISTRLLASYLGKYELTSVAGRIDRAGEYLVPKWSANGSVTLDLDDFSGTLDGRWYQGGILDATAVAGTATSNNVDHVRGSLYLSLSLQYTIAKGANDRKVELFSLVNNLGDLDPPFPNAGIPSVAVPMNVLDFVGRSFRFGVRFKY